MLYLICQYNLSQINLHNATNLHILFSLGDRQLNLNPIYSNTMDATSGAGTSYPSGEPEFTPGF